ncbi:monoacylglycerol lipase ABHD6 isoform X2 [Rhinatrema bivittatum]|uniref:monoacylglycerol lipase ABHD6 isoform X2 n=1 Tax=Rhinatrema bivittatum TaxID=194408 RepID=UPI0011261D4E|nr:monoacylglycerol lipase ABHD6 isoform X2 [Rhinatrema bivittatum]
MDLDVINIFMIAGSTLAIPILAFIASFLLWPSALIRFYYWYWRRALGMQVRYAHHEDYQFCYLYRGRPGSKPSLLFLHGFTAHKDTWLSVVKFVESIKLNRKPFHLVGTSMGGSVAGVYAAQHPSDICGLSLICPAGLKAPNNNEFVKQMQDIKNSENVHRTPLIPSTPQEMEDMLRLCSYVRFKVPQQILQGLVDDRIPHNDFYRKLLLELLHDKSCYALQEKMDKIAVPTQIIWGKQDQVLDVSGADILANAIPGCQVVILDNCGHTVAVERPRKTAKLILDFLVPTHSTENNKKLL